MTFRSPHRLGASALLGLLQALLSLMTACGPADAGGSEGWYWPLEPRPEVVQEFHRPDDPWAVGHRGVDLAGRTGQPVLAIGDGTIVFAGTLAGRGVVVVSHGSLRSTYEPVTAAADVGDKVAAGDVIGLLQSVQSHCLPAACLHLGVRRGPTYLDPLTFLGPREVRLKPPTGGTGTSFSVQVSRAPPTEATITPERDVEPSASGSTAAVVLGGLAVLGSAMTLTTLARRR